jgi:prevent-host-death family protein
MTFAQNEYTGGDHMKTMPVADARAHMRDLLDSAVAGQPVVLTRNGKPVAVVVPASFLTIGSDYPADENQTVPV